MKNNFAKRTATSAIFVIVLIGSILFHPVSFFILFSFIVIVGQFEFYKIALKAGYQPQVLTGAFLGLAFFVANTLYASSYASGKIFSIFPLIIIILMIIELFRDRELPFVNISIALFGSIFVAGPFSLVNYLVYNPVFNGEYNGYILIAVFVLIWASDSGAYIVGSSIGKHKLFERISPKKTWEGFIGGGLISMAAAWLISIYIPEIDLIHWLFISAITVIFGTFGDLIESLLKRKVNIKDSGTLLPGHGGILDRFDSLLFAVPVIFFYISVFC